jgi:hypothetical protein
VTAEQKVRQKYPKAVPTLHGIFGNRLMIVVPPRNTEMDGFWGEHLSDHFDSEEEAWADAWRKIQAGGTE